MTDSTHSIELTIGKVSLGVSGPQEFVEEQFYDLYEKHGFDDIDVSPSDIDVSVGNSTDGDSRVSEQQNEYTEPTVDAALNELLSDSDINTKQDTALTVGWYLIAGRSQVDITFDEVKEEADRSQVDLGKKVHRDLRSNVGKGYLGPTGDTRDDDDTYEVTESGKEYLREKGIPA